MIRLFRLRSTLTLILCGFGVVALPLLFALGYAGLYVDRLGGQAQTAVYNGARAIQASRSLAESLTAMERTARQYLLLGDPQLFASYTESHEQFQATVDQLAVLTAGEPHNSVVSEIARRETNLFNRLANRKQRQGLSQDAVAETFTELAEMAEAISVGSNLQIDREVDFMQDTATTAQRWLFYMGVALIPLTLISTAIFTVLISRPIRQMDRAIRQLGDGRFTDPIAVSGPADLHALGERLDWLRRRLIELEGEKTRFLHHVSHELKTPLTAVRESSELLGEEVVGPLNEEQREITDILHDSGRRLQTLIEDLLHFSQVNDHRPRLRLRSVRLEKLVETVLQNHKPAILAKSVEVDLRLQPCQLTGDGDKLRTVVDNLLSNAIKFSPERGRLTVRTHQTQSMALLEVADEGPGIAAAERDKIFEAFFQGSKQPGGYVKGSGLGLSIAREYVMAHDGGVDILSGRGPGTRLRVVFPRKPVKARLRAAY